jgi:hypothetical protein
LLKSGYGRFYFRDRCRRCDAQRQLAYRAKKRREDPVGYRERRRVISERNNRRRRARPNDLVPVELMRQALQDTDLPRDRVALNLGWYYDKGRTEGDVRRLERALGNAPHTKRIGMTTREYWPRTVEYPTAVRMVEAMGLDPLDYGL